jgi:molecular chaperone DnaK
MPQIEVTFDIDANGILNVSAKDLGTGKEQRIEIKGGSGLSDEEVQKMVSDAESHADEDRKAKELAEARNVAEARAFQFEKELGEHEAVIDDATKAEIKDAIAAVRGSLDSSDADDIKAKTTALETAFHKASEQIYASAQAQASGPDGGSANGASAEGEGRSSMPRSSRRRSSGRTPTADSELP